MHARNAQIEQLRCRSEANGIIVSLRIVADSGNRESPIGSVSLLHVPLSMLLEHGFQVVRLEWFTSN